MRRPLFPMLPMIAMLGLATCAWADPDYVPDQICCMLEAGYTIEEINQRWGTTTLMADLETEIYLLHAPPVGDLLEFVALMAQDEAIDVVDVNWRLETPEGVRQMVVAVVGGTWGDFADQSMTRRIGLDAAHAITRGAGVTVAVLDTGVDPSHEVFAGRLTTYGFDCIDFDQYPWETSNGLDDDGDGQIDEGFGHGTMVAGLIALVAPEARIMPIRVLDDDGRGTLFGVAKGIIAASAHGANVINASFGTPQVAEMIKRKLRVADLHSVFTVAGAGNRDLEFPPYHPACDSLAFMVTALDSADVKADFADYSAQVIVSAPGVGIRSAHPEGWAIGSGCSFATPLVAGEMALLLSVQPVLGYEIMRGLLVDGVDPIYYLPGNQPYADKLGTGRINLPRALGDMSAVPIRDHAAGGIRVWPNPARDKVQLALAGEAPGPWRLSVHDAAGRLVQTARSANGGPLGWSARDLAGRPVPPGTYYIRLTAGARTATSAITILR